MNKCLWIFLLCATLLNAQSLYFPPVHSDEWQQIDPDALGWSADAMSDLHTFLDEKNTKAFIILKDGKIVVEWYFDDHDQDKYWYWASAGKTITAFLIGKAQEESYLSIDDASSKYLGEGWSSLPLEAETKITIRHQLSMTTGLNDRVEDNHCTLPECLQFQADPGERWAYHNAPYTLLENVLEAATGMSRNEYTRAQLSQIGLQGLWFQNGFNNIFSSTARSMARFGLLILNNGVWDGQVIMQDSVYFHDMITPSQDINPSYGYLWWLNGQGTYMLPGVQWQLNTDLVPAAPSDLVAALGKNDQKLYVVKSQNMVVVRMGDSAEQSKVAISSFDNQLWELISALEQPTLVTTDVLTPSELRIFPNYPNPFNSSTTFTFELPEPGNVSLVIMNVRGQHVKEMDIGFKQAGHHTFSWEANESEISSGVYYYQIQEHAKGLLKTKPQPFLFVK